MESEGSSAVLELKDDDTGTDDGSIDNTAGHSHDIDDALPLIMEHGYDIVVKVDAPMKQLSTLETFVTYRVRCVCARWSAPPYVRRRYNHFKVLHKRLTSAHPLLPVPPLPPLHSARQQLDRYSPGFVAVRTLALDAFLARVAKHPILTHSQDLRLFLTLSDDELDRSFKSESGVLSLWGLTTAFYNSGEAKTSNGPRVKDLEFSSVTEYLQSLQQKLTTLCSLTTKLYKVSASLGAELMNSQFQYRVEPLAQSGPRRRPSARFFLPFLSIPFPSIPSLSFLPFHSFHSSVPSLPLLHPAFLHPLADLHVPHSFLPFPSIPPFLPVFPPFTRAAFQPIRLFPHPPPAPASLTPLSPAPAFLTPAFARAGVPHPLSPAPAFLTPAFAL
ncbi:Sorting nexin-7 [Eumeta japonica]|uniref:Sorting nexin-7 n=1 Tax=Eumeta variegata TaxID=151549 RepID=A0A4C1TA30_EUMVA|nr:Sorting nexin-7 [Eumeta japonica]